MINLIKFFPSIANSVDNIEQMKGKSVLVTGASGLIGNHVVSTLVDVGADVHVTIHTTYPFVMKNVTTHRFHNLPSELAFDYIFHLAGYGQPFKFNKNKCDTLYINTQYTISLFNFLKYKTGKMLFASTSEVYSGLEIEATEYMIGTTTPAHRRAAYIEGKRVGETIVHTMNETNIYGQSKIARIALSYGPGVKYDDSRVMSDFIRSALEYGVIKPKGGLNKIRTYCYVADTVEMLFNILLNGEHTTYNVGGINRISIRDLALKIAKFANAEVEFLVGFSIEDESPEFVGVSINRYLKEFKKSSFITLDEGLVAMIEWFNVLKKTIK